jgi:hypothetical protein
MASDQYRETTWSWEPPVYLKGTPDWITNIRERFKAITDAVGSSRTDVANRMWLRIMELVETDPTIIDHLGEINNAVTKRYCDTINRKSEIKRLQVIYEDGFEFSNDEFIQWCQESGVDESMYMKVVKGVNRISVESMIPEWKQQFLRWLQAGILSDGQAHHTDEVKVAAVNDGIIGGTSGKDWNRLRNVASEYGYTSDQKGWWQAPKE